MFRFPRTIYVPRPGWRFWLAAALLLWAGLGAGALWGLGRAAEAAAQVTRFRAGQPAGDDALDQVTAGQRFNLLGWEAHALARWLLDALVTPSSAPEPQALAHVTRYFELTTALQRGRLRLAAADTTESRAQVTAGLAALQRERDALETGVRQTLNQLVTAQLVREGLGYDAPVAGQGVFPPVAFSITRPPSVLVISPRDRIATERRTVLQPGVSDATAEEMEAAAEALGWSAIVEPTGGFSTYPTIVSDSAPLDFTLQTVAHEWTHTYLFFRPLGFNYFSAEQMATINETVANLAGREVARAIRASWLPQAPAPPATSPPPAPRPPFDFAREMRTTRLEAERLLKEGAIAEAEAYMEARRKVLVENGYAIRKLNQAYFAFHGAYADTPGSVSPIGPALERLLQATGSVAGFLRAVEHVDSYAAYQSVLARYGISETPPTP
jgi:hypothetical protein